MGLFFRKSVRVGPFRFTLSKRGIGTSFGGRAGRVSVSPTGRVTRTLRVPGTGLSWRRSGKRPW